MLKPNTSSASFSHDLCALSHMLQLFTVADMPDSFVYCVQCGAHTLDNKDYNFCGKCGRKFGNSESLRHKMSAHLLVLLVLVEVRAALMIQDSRPEQLLVRRIYMKTTDGEHCLLKSITRERNSRDVLPFAQRPRSPSTPKNQRMSP